MCMCNLFRNHHFHSAYTILSPPAGFESPNPHTSPSALGNTQFQAGDVVSQCGLNWHVTNEHLSMGLTFMYHL